MVPFFFRRKPSNEGAFFVLPSQLNGAERLGFELLRRGSRGKKGRGFLPRKINAWNLRVLEYTPGNPSSKPSFSGSMLIFGSVCSYVGHFLVTNQSGFGELKTQTMEWRIFTQWRFKGFFFGRWVKYDALNIHLWPPPFCKQVAGGFVHIVCRIFTSKPWGRWRSWRYHFSKWSEWNYHL